VVNYLLKGRNDFVFLWAYSTSINVLHKKWQLASRDSSGIAHLFCVVAGVEGGRLVEAHGSFSTASCTRCHSKQDPQDVKAAIFSDQIPKCKHCNVSDSFVNARAALVVYCHREL
jgi:NAD-dependent SIR2 family protein deacetylase